MMIIILRVKGMSMKKNEIIFFMVICFMSLTFLMHAFNWISLDR